MAGISSKALQFGNPENKFGITGKEKQSKEFKDGAGMEWYDFGARMQDPQLGRWHTVDPLVSNYYWLTPYNYCNNNPIKYLDPNGMEFKDTVMNGKHGRYDVATLAEVSVTGKSKNGNGSQALSYRTQMADHWIHKRDLYGQARYNGWSPSQMAESWSKHGVSKRDLEIYESRYQRMMNFRNVQLVTVGVLGAPLVATTVSPAVFAGSFKLRMASAGSELLSQYLMNTLNYGFGADNLNSINFSAVGAELILPKSALGSAIIGNSFKFTLESGYNGVSSTASGTYILTNIGLNYGANKVGEVHGIFLGSMLSNSSQTVFDMYDRINQ